MSEVRMDRRHRRSPHVRTVTVVLVGVLVATLLLFSALVAFGTITGLWRVVPVLSNSMQPAFERGDALVVRPKPVAELRAGDVLVFDSPELPTVPSRRTVHRVVEVVDPGTLRDPVPGAVFVRTKGDASEDPDPWVAAITDQQVWTVSATVPDVGHVVLAATNRMVRAGLLGAAALVFAGTALAMLRRPPPPPRPPPDRRGPWWEDQGQPDPPAPAARVGASTVLAAALGCLAGATGLAVGAAALLSDQEVTAASIGSGAVALDLDAPVASLPALLPSQQADATVSVTNVGDVTLLGASGGPAVGLQLTLSNQNASPLLANPSDGLLVTVDSCSRPWTIAFGPDGLPVATCPGTQVPLAPERPAAARINLPAGPAHQPGGVTHLRLRFRLSDSAPQSLAGQAATVGIAVTGVSRNGVAAP